jgi:hypothetical protein
VTSPKRTWWLCIQYGKPWHFDAFWATLCTLKSHKNIPIILWHLPTGPTPIRCTRHLPHCCPARVQLLWHFNEKHTLLKIQKKRSKAHWCVICCPIQMAILGYSNEQMQVIYEQKRFFRPGMIETNESSQVLQITNMYRCS